MHLICLDIYTQGFFSVEKLQVTTNAGGRGLCCVEPGLKDPWREMTETWWKRQSTGCLGDLLRIGLLDTMSSVW